jgi:TolB-like protein
LRVFSFLFCFLVTFIFFLNGLVWAEVDEQEDEQRIVGKVDKRKEKSVSASKSYRLMARDLLGQPHWSERLLNLLDDHIPQIAVPPLPVEELPISSQEAQIYVDGFTRALINASAGRYAVVARKELDAVVKDINEMGMRSDSINPLGNLIERARSDLIAVGHLALQGEQIILSYKLVESETGRIVSASQRTFKRKEHVQIHNAGALSVQGAAKKAAQDLMRDIPQIKKIMVQGMRYQSSGIHTGFGRYFMEMLSDALRKQAASGPRNINDLDIAPFVIEEERFRGLQLNFPEKKTQRSSLTGQYILKGTYWVFDETVELRLRLEGEDGKAQSWRGRIVKNEIPRQLALIPPPAPIEETDNKPIGPIDLFLSSNKGDNPLYKTGEKMVLAVRTGDDAHLYCYYIQADGILFRIFPNRFLPSSHINGGFLQYIPPAAVPFAFEFSPPSGVEAVKCYALTRDVSNELNAAFSVPAFEALPYKNERELTRLFRNLKKTKLSEASLIVTVEDK